jgi:hypothetical protein
MSDGISLRPVLDHDALQLRAGQMTIGRKAVAVVLLLYLTACGSIYPSRMRSDDTALGRLCSAIYEFRSAGWEAHYLRSTIPTAEKVDPEIASALRDLTEGVRRDEPINTDAFGPIKEKCQA